MDKISNGVRQYDFYLPDQKAFLREDVALEKDLLKHETENSTRIYIEKIEKLILEDSNFDLSNPAILIRCDAYIKWIDVELEKLYRFAKQATKENKPIPEQKKEEILRLLTIQYKLIEDVMLKNSLKIVSTGSEHIYYNIDMGVYANLILLFDDFRVVYCCIRVINAANIRQDHASDSAVALLKHRDRAIRKLYSVINELIKLSATVSDFRELISFGLEKSPDAKELFNQEILDIYQSSEIIQECFRKQELEKPTEKVGLASQYHLNVEDSEDNATQDGILILRDLDYSKSTKQLVRELRKGRFCLKQGEHHGAKLRLQTLLKYNKCLVSNSPAQRIELAKCFTLLDSLRNNFRMTASGYSSKDKELIVKQQILLALNFSAHGNQLLDIIHLQKSLSNSSDVDLSQLFTPVTEAFMKKIICAFDLTNPKVILMTDNYTIAKLADFLSLRFYDAQVIQMKLNMLHPDFEQIYAKSQSFLELTMKHFTRIYELFSEEVRKPRAEQNSTLLFKLSLIINRLYFIKSSDVIYDENNSVSLQLKQNICQLLFLMVENDNPAFNNLSLSHLFHAHCDINLSLANQVISVAEKRYSSLQKFAGTVIKQFFQKKNKFAGMILVSLFICYGENFKQKSLSNKFLSEVWKCEAQVEHPVIRMIFELMKADCCVEFSQSQNFWLMLKYCILVLRQQQKTPLLPEFTQAMSQHIIILFSDYSSMSRYRIDFDWEQALLQAPDQIESYCKALSANEEKIQALIRKGANTPGMPTIYIRSLIEFFERKYNNLNIELWNFLCFQYDQINSNSNSLARAKQLLKAVIVKMVKFASQLCNSEEFSSAQEIVYLKDNSVSDNLKKPSVLELFEIICENLSDCKNLQNPWLQQIIASHQKMEKVYTNNQNSANPIQALQDAYCTSSFEQISQPESHSQYLKKAKFISKAMEFQATLQSTCSQQVSRTSITQLMRHLDSFRTLVAEEIQVSAILQHKQLCRYLLHPKTKMSPLHLKPHETIDELLETSFFIHDRHCAYSEPMPSYGWFCQYAGKMSLWVGQLNDKQTKERFMKSMVEEILKLVEDWLLPSKPHPILFKIVLLHKVVQYGQLILQQSWDKSSLSHFARTILKYYQELNIYAIDSAAIALEVKDYYQQGEVKSLEQGVQNIVHAIVKLNKIILRSLTRTLLQMNKKDIIIKTCNLDWVNAFAALHECAGKEILTQFYLDVKKNYVKSNKLQKTCSNELKKTLLTETCVLIMLSGHKFGSKYADLAQLFYNSIASDSSMVDSLFNYPLGIMVMQRNIMLMQLLPLFKKFNIQLDYSNTTNRELIDLDLSKYLQMMHIEKLQLKQLSFLQEYIDFSYILQTCQLSEDNVSASQYARAVHLAKLVSQVVIKECLFVQVHPSLILELTGQAAGFVSGVLKKMAQNQALHGFRGLNLLMLIEIQYSLLRIWPAWEGMPKKISQDELVQLLDKLVELTAAFLQLQPELPSGAVSVKDVEPKIQMNLSNMLRHIGELLLRYNFKDLALNKRIEEVIFAVLDIPVKQYQSYLIPKIQELLAVIILYYQSFLGELKAQQIFKIAMDVRALCQTLVLEKQMTIDEFISSHLQKGAPNTDPRALYFILAALINQISPGSSPSGSTPINGYIPKLKEQLADYETSGKLAIAIKETCISAEEKHFLDQFIGRVSDRIGQFIESIQTCYLFDISAMSQLFQVIFISSNQVANDYIMRQLYSSQLMMKYAPKSLQAAENWTFLDECLLLNGLTAYNLSYIIVWYAVAKNDDALTLQIVERALSYLNQILEAGCRCLEFMICAGLVNMVAEIMRKVCKNSQIEKISPVVDKVSRFCLQKIGSQNPQLTVDLLQEIGVGLLLQVCIEKYETHSLSKEKPSFDCILQGLMEEGTGAGLCGNEESKESKSTAEDRLAPLLPGSPSNCEINLTQAQDAGQILLRIDQQQIVDAFQLYLDRHKCQCLDCGIVSVLDFYEDLFAQVKKKCSADPRLPLQLLKMNVTIPQNKYELEDKYAKDSLQVISNKLLPMRLLDSHKLNAQVQKNIFQFLSQDPILASLQQSISCLRGVSVATEYPNQFFADEKIRSSIANLLSVSLEIDYCSEFCMKFLSARISEDQVIAMLQQAALNIRAADKQIEAEQSQLIQSSIQTCFNHLLGIVMESDIQDTRAIKHLGDRVGQQALVSHLQQAQAHLLALESQVPLREEEKKADTLTDAKPQNSLTLLAPGHAVSETQQQPVNQPEDTEKNAKEQGKVDGSQAPDSVQPEQWRRVEGLAQNLQIPFLFFQQEEFDLSEFSKLPEKEQKGFLRNYAKKFVQSLIKKIQTKYSDAMFDFHTERIQAEFLRSLYQPQISNSEFDAQINQIQVRQEQKLSAFVSSVDCHLLNSLSTYINNLKDEEQHKIAFEIDEWLIGFKNYFKKFRSLSNAECYKLFSLRFPKQQQEAALKDKSYFSDLVLLLESKDKSQDEEEKNPAEADKAGEVVEGKKDDPIKTKNKDECTIDKNGLPFRYFERLMSYLLEFALKKTEQMDQIQEQKSNYSIQNIKSFLGNRLCMQIIYAQLIQLQIRNESSAQCILDEEHSKLENADGRSARQMQDNYEKQKAIRSHLQTTYDLLYTMSEQKQFDEYFSDKSFYTPVQEFFERCCPEEHKIWVQKQPCSSMIYHIYEFANRFYQLVFKIGWRLGEYQESMIKELQSQRDLQEQIKNMLEKFFYSKQIHKCWLDSLRGSAPKNNSEGAPLQNQELDQLKSQQLVSGLVRMGHCIQDLQAADDLIPKKYQTCGLYSQVLAELVKHQCQLISERYAYVMRLLDRFEKYLKTEMKIDFLDDEDNSVRIQQCQNAFRQFFEEVYQKFVNNYLQKQLDLFKERFKQVSLRQTAIYIQENNLRELADALKNQDHAKFTKEQREEIISIKRSIKKKLLSQETLISIKEQIEKLAHSFTRMNQVYISLTNYYSSFFKRYIDIIGYFYNLYYIGLENQGYKGNSIKNDELDLDLHYIGQMPQLQKMVTRTESYDEKKSSALEQAETDKTNIQLGDNFMKAYVKFIAISSSYEDNKKFLETICSVPGIKVPAEIKYLKIQSQIQKYGQMLKDDKPENDEKFEQIKKHNEPYFKLRSRVSNYRIYLVVERADMFWSSIRQMSVFPFYQIVRCETNIQFEDENGIDGGGLTTEWYSKVCLQILDPKFKLFTYSSNGITCQPSIESASIPNYKTYFKFLGVLLGKAIQSNHSCCINLARNFLKHIVKKNLCINDLEDISEDVAKNLKWILDNDITDAELGLNFVYTMKIRGQEVSIELLPKGKDIQVTEQNKKLYVKAIANWLMIGSIKEQIRCFLDGFFLIVPQATISRLTVSELGLLLAGQQEINKTEMFQNINFSVSPTTLYLKEWMLEILNGFNNEQLQKFLFYVTGSFKPPATGFTDFSLNVHFYTTLTTSHLPNAHTCSRQIDVPIYESKESMENKLILAINEGVEGFFIS